MAQQTVGFEHRLSPEEATEVLRRFRTEEGREAVLPPTTLGPTVDDLAQALSVPASEVALMLDKVRETSEPVRRHKSEDEAWQINWVAWGFAVGVVAVVFMLAIVFAMMSRSPAPPPTQEAPPVGTSE